MRFHTQTNQLEEDVCGQREMEILGGELPLKESDDVVSGNAQRLTFHLAELLVCKYIEQFSHFQTSCDSLLMCVLYLLHTHTVNNIVPHIFPS